MAPTIPERWLDYKSIGKCVPGTRFIAFKVPLNPESIKCLNKNQRLTTNTLIKKIPKLGMIIDLTNTNRYYSPKTFNTEGVQHMKLCVPGQSIPSDTISMRFKDLVKNFLAVNANNDKLIGVHCTHGVNRTGYLICHYMISEMSFPPNLAIAKFAMARGHSIERLNYINALRSLPAKLEKRLAKKNSQASREVAANNALTNNLMTPNPQQHGMLQQRAFMYPTPTEQLYYSQDVANRQYSNPGYGPNNVRYAGNIQYPPTNNAGLYKTKPNNAYMQPPHTANPAYILPRLNNVYSGENVPTKYTK